MDEEDTVNMVWHDDKRVHGCVGEMGRDGIPVCLHEAAQCVDPHFPTRHLAKNMFAPEGNDGEEIATRLGVIVSFQANGCAVVSLGI